MCNIPSFKKGLSRCWPQKSGDQVKGRCLARTIWSNKGCNSLLFNVEGKAINGMYPIKGLNQIFYLKYFHPRNVIVCEKTEGLTYYL